MSAGRWYAGGLRFGCRRCGACCSGAPGYVWIRPEECAAAAGRLGLSEPVFLARHTRAAPGGLSLRELEDGRCEFLEAGGGCAIYEVRPRQCCSWPFWARVVASPEAWAREAEHCPGMGAGELFDAERIERLAGLSGVAKAR